MGDTPTEDGRDRSDETAKLELPSLSLPRLGRRKRQPEQEQRTERVESEPAPPPAAVTVAEPVTRPEPQPAPAPEPATEHEPATEQRAPAPTPEETSSRRRSFALPQLSGRVVALVTGLLVGVFGAALTVLSLRGCDVLRGTKSCGGTAGLLLLAVILVLMVLLGGVLLAFGGLPDARATSFLAVGVLNVVVLLTLLEQLFSPWMFLVVPVLTALSYLLAHWVTTTFIEPVPERGPEHDVR